MGTSSNGPGSSIKIELGSKEAENYYNRKDNSINNDYCQQVNIYDDVEEEPIYDSEDEAHVNISQENKKKFVSRVNTFFIGSTTVHCTLHCTVLSYCTG